MTALQQKILQDKRNQYRALMNQISHEEHEKFKAWFDGETLTPDQWIENLDFHINPAKEQELMRRLANIETEYQLALRLCPEELDSELNYPEGMTLNQKCNHVAQLLHSHYDEEMEYESWFEENGK